jgi:hypothetical protein
MLNQSDLLQPIPHFGSIGRRGIMGAGPTPGRAGAHRLRRAAPCHDDHLTVQRSSP